MDAIKYIVVLVILAGAAGFIVQHDKHVADKAVLEAGVSTAKKSAEVLQEVIDNADDLSKVRAREIAVLKSTNESLKQKLATMGGVSRAWLDTPVDPDVRRVRHAAYEGGGTGLVLRPTEGTTANPGATTERPDQRQPAAGSERQQGRSDSVQQGQGGRAEVIATPEQTTSILKRIRALRGEK